ncbi:hypothetical protein PsYK624_031780 [Phanerochaete sordida]|uniref:Uncharacterized protein n=1 Tax=Phanerochaete sordida TaxID=48140 RepID=A0A9P3G3A2_9APHY|nr:hypothetical protein PsYK624_031780 [Phanerochaete sordida]
MPRKPPPKAAEPSDDSGSEREYDEEEEDREMLEMVAVLKQFQKRKTTKHTARSAAFLAKKDALFAEARRNAENAVKEGVAYIEQYRAKIADLRAREVSHDACLKDMSLFSDREAAIKAVLAAFPPLLDDLSHRRAEAINGTSEMLEAHSAERHQSRRRLIKQAKARIDEEQENQRVATDASALIKHYKALLLS